MIGMRLNVVHLQVHQKKNRAKDSDAFHNYSTLLTGIEPWSGTNGSDNEFWIHKFKNGLCFLVIWTLKPEWLVQSMYFLLFLYHTAVDVTTFNATLTQLFFMKNYSYKALTEARDSGVKWVKDVGARFNILPLVHLPQCTLFAHQNFASPFFVISPGYYSPPKRNKRQCLIKILGGKHGVSWEMWKWRIQHVLFFFLLALKYFYISGCNRCKNSLAEMKRTGSPRPSLLLINRDPFNCL